MGKNRKGLRHKLMQLSMSLTLIGVGLLVIGMVTVVWLRVSASRLTEERTPAVVATKRAQIGLHSSLAGLRGWVVLGDRDFLEQRAEAWGEQIEPALDDLLLLAESWPDPDDRQHLNELGTLLDELKESQWWVEDVARTEGNELARQAVHEHVDPVSRSLLKVVNALIAEARVTSSAQDGIAMLRVMVGLRHALVSVQAALVRFVADGEEVWARAFDRAIRDARDELAGLALISDDLNSTQREQLAHLQKEFPWYERFATEALEVRRSETWNVALYRMSSETLPLTAEVTELLDTLALHQNGLMSRDTSRITFAGNGAIVLSLILIVLMAAIAYALASYRSNQITEPISALSHATEELAGGFLRRNLPITTDDELGALTHSFNRMRVRLQESEAALLDANQDLERHNRFVRDTFGRYLSDDVVTNLLDTPEGLQLGGESRDVTIVMSDLRGFTSLSGRLEPEQVVRILNRYFGVMVEVITRYQGTIDEFIGDAILVIFGAPAKQVDHAEAAVACAAAMQIAMAEVNEANRRDNLPEVEMGIGVNTGRVVVGNIGSDTRAKYGVVGAPVNLTSRIESYTIGGQILISDATRQAVGPILELGDPVEIDAKGVSLPVTIYDVKAVTGRHGLVLPTADEVLVKIEPVLSIRYALLEEKHLVEDLFEGKLLKLSVCAAHVLSQRTVKPLTNIKMEVMDEEEKKVVGELYAKVTGPLTGDAKGFAVHFTSVPPELATFFKRVMCRN
jgi:adenylate cyclase